MRCVVLGAKGQLGRDLCPLLGPDVIPLSRADLDLSNPAGAKAILESHRPDIVINCSTLITLSTWPKRNLNLRSTSMPWRFITWRELAASLAAGSFISARIMFLGKADGEARKPRRFTNRMRPGQSASMGLANWLVNTWRLMPVQQPW